MIEVSDTTLMCDRTRKQRLYARVGIPWYWIINLSAQQIECYSALSGPSEEPAYARREKAGLNDSVRFVLDGQEIVAIARRDLLP